MKTIKSIDMNSAQLNNVAAPTSNTDAVNKAYVDAQVASVANNVSADNLTIIDQGSYYEFDWVDNGGAVSIVDQGDYITLTIA